MHKPRPSEPDAEILPEQVASRVLARASELDAARRTGAAVTDLRAAAVEAGISTQAFDAALAEERAASDAQVSRISAHPRRRPGLGTLAAFAILLLGGVFFVGRTVVPVAPPMVEEAILLRCLSSGQAAELVRPLLDLPANTVVSSANGPRVLTIRATPSQMARVRSLLERNDAGSATCSPVSTPD